MDTFTKSAVNVYLSISSWFIPDSLHDNPLEWSRAQNVVGAAAIAAISDPFYALIYYLVGFKSAALEILACGLLMVSAPFILKFTRRLKIAGQTIVGALYFNFTWLSYHLGGISAPTVPWLAVCPIVAIVLGGARSGVVWLFISCMTIAWFHLLHLMEASFPTPQVANVLLLESIVNAGLFPVIVGLVLYFEFTKTQGFIKLQQALELIQETATHDELTGIYNRRHIINLLAVEKNRADRLAVPFCICILDIDYFKRINDTFGHAAGDAVLKAFAKAVEAKIRSVDLFGRYGGEEFLLICPQTDHEEAMALAERARIEIEMIEFPWRPVDLNITVSIGVAKYQIGERVEQTIASADHALYEAKSKGRNNVVLHVGDDTSDEKQSISRTAESSTTPS